MVKRTLQVAIEQSLFQGKVVVIYGARQVGKTTLSKDILVHMKDHGAIYLNADEPDIRHALTDKTSTELKAFLGNHKLVVIDEAQRVPNIGLTLKLCVDNFPDIQIIATGSSSFELSNQLSESLTGRKVVFQLHPFSLEELRANESSIELDRMLERRMLYGMYPEVAMTHGDVSEKIRMIATSYTYKDAFAYQGIQNPEVLERLVQALALQIGSEVSYTELAQLIGRDRKTVESYVRILEQAFIVFRLSPFSRNLRNELKRLRKIYFYDTGIRNALINNFNPLHLRQDVGALWENFFISERIKHTQNHGKMPNRYFWRTHQGKEIDYIEELAGTITGYECKWGKSTSVVPKDFATAYPHSTVTTVSRDNYHDALLGTV